MASTATALIISESVYGKGVKIAATASSGTLLHTAVASTTTQCDEVVLHFYNSHTASVVVTVQWGGTTSPDNDIKYTVLAQDTVKCVIPGFRIQNALEIRAYASVTNVLIAYGQVNRITNS